MAQLEFRGLPCGWGGGDDGLVALKVARKACIVFSSAFPSYICVTPIRDDFLVRDAYACYEHSTYPSKVPRIWSAYAHHTQ